MLCYTVYRSSLQALPLPSSMAHLKLCAHRLAQLTSCYAIPSSAAHLKLYYTV